MFFIEPTKANIPCRRELVLQVSAKRAEHGDGRWEHAVALPRGPQMLAVFHEHKLDDVNVRPHEVFPRATHARAHKVPEAGAGSSTVPHRRGSTGAARWEHRAAGGSPGGSLRRDCRFPF